MVKISILIALLPYLLYTTVRGTTLCSEYFMYTIDPETRNILGQVSIPPAPENGEFYLKVALNAADDLLRGIFRLELARSIKESVQAVEQCRPLLYHIYFPWDENLPIISAIWFNDQLFCLGPGVSRGNITATIELGYIVYPPNEESLSQNFQPWHRNSTSYRINNPTYNNNNNYNDECGITSYYTDISNSMIPNGNTTLRGQWPWVAAIYMIKNVEDKILEYKGAGSLLTTKHIITAAHCLKFNSTSNDFVHPHMFEIILGRLNFDEICHNKETIKREIESYKIHPDYTHTTTGDSDLAILTLSLPIEFNPFVRSICLWSGPTSLQNVVGRTGYVVGWALKKRDQSQYFDEPRMVKVPIVNQATCLWSDGNYYRLMSERTFCAGLLDKSEVCIGDRGSGLMLFDNTTGRYQLRGVLSRIGGVQNFWCNVRKYNVYVDVAKYIPWIKQQISTT